MFVPSAVGLAAILGGRSAALCAPEMGSVHSEALKVILWQISTAKQCLSR